MTDRITKLASLIAEEIAAQGNETDNLGDDESLCLTGPLPTINLVQLAERIIASLEEED